ncbi:MAG: V-type ATP synthase subunit F [Ferroplasma sp.]
MQDICLIGERELVAGFKLVGINDAYEANPETDSKKLKDIFTSKKYNVILASQSFQKYIDEDELRLYSTSIDPLVVFIPIPGIKEEESVYDLARKILGIDIGD